ncbi:MAG: dihydropteroate synthase [Haloferacaceae archaeon]
MRYHEAADFLFDLRRFSMSPGIESVRDLLSELGDPHEGITWVQVAGSNGKGSTSRMVESMLRESDRRVGLFTSPHLDDVRERVRVDGRKITRSALTEFVETIKPYLVDQAAGGEPLTFFETTTAMALWYFDRAGVDVGVLEVGMGGELDATSVVDPVASCVTNVTLEHTAVLGDTIEEIATTKAYVAPAENPLVTATTGEALEAVRSKAGDVLTVGEDDADVLVEYGGRADDAESAVSVTGPGWEVDARIPLLGSYQAANAGIAVALARQVAPDLPGESVARGLRKAHWPGRFEVMTRSPTVVLDGAHNPGACETVAETVAEFDYDDLRLVFAAMHDKDHDGMVAALPEPDSVVTCRPDLQRAEDPEVLAEVFERAGVEDVTVGDAVSDALRTARTGAGDDDLVLVVGSLFCVAEARTTWTRAKVPKAVDDVETASRVLEAAEVPAEGVRAHAADAVHRVVKTRLSERQATLVREAALEVGGECAVSGLGTGGELLDVVLMGTRAQFAALLDRLDGAGEGLAGVSDELRGVLDLDGRERRVGGATGGDDAAGGDGAAYPWEDGTAVMGVLNVTPDSFYDGGEYAAADDAAARAEEMVAAGADIVDVGGESTRPGAEPVSVDEELSRVVPVIERVSDLDAAVSVDTRRAEVARAALDAGADIVNDVSGLADPEMRFLAAEREVPVVVMHSIDAPVVPDRDVPYDDVVEDVIAELEERVLLAEKAGVPRERIVVDPGIGFGKSATENFALLGRLDELRGIGCPVLLGHSRKSMYAAVDVPAEERLAPTVAATGLAVERGVDVVRVHDVAENAAAVRVAEAARDPDSLGD